MAISCSSTLCMGYALLITFLFTILKLMVTLKVPFGFFMQTVVAEHGIIDGSIDSAFLSFSSSDSIASTTVRISLEQSSKQEFHLLVVYNILLWLIPHYTYFKIRL